MKSIFEKFLDIIYDYLDYIVMLAIILIVVGIIGWRLDIIFTGDTTASRNVSTENVDENNDDENGSPGQAEDLDESDSPIDNDETDQSDETNETDDVNQEDDLSEEDQEAPDVPETVDNTEVSIEIPSGTMPHEIASILLEGHLIADTSSFLERAQELNVVTKLKAGDYMIQSDCSIDEILEILSK